jgi:hypothetical protein
MIRIFGTKFHEKNPMNELRVQVTNTLAQIKHAHAAVPSLPYREKEEEEEEERVRAMHCCVART